MKTKILSLAVLFILGIGSIFAQNKSEKFKVNGNCGLCEKTIEKAAKSVDGVSIAEWNKDTKEMEIVFDSSKTNIHKIHMAISKSGYDTQMHKATDKAYASLPGCCQYDRNALKKQVNNKHHDHSGHKH